jgi:hypothetical protein
MPNLSLEFEINRVDDKQVAETAARCFQETSWELSHATFAFPFGGGSLNCAAGELDGCRELDEILDHRIELITDFVYKSTGGGRLTVTRGNHEAHVDKVALNSGPRDTVPDFAKIVAVVKRHFGALAPARFLDSLAGSSAGHALEAREAALARLEATAAHLLTESEQARKRWETEFRQKEKQLIGDARQKAEQLEAAYKERERRLLAQTDEARKRRQTEYQKKEQQLLREIDERTQRLADQYGQWEERLKLWEEELSQQSERLMGESSRHRLLEHLKARLADQHKTFKLSRGSRWLRRSISTFLAALVLLFGGASAYYLLQTFEAPDPRTLVLATVNQAVFLVLFVGASVWFVRWHSRWFRRRTAEEFRFKRLEAEIVRAGWRAETAFDWKERFGTDIPADSGPEWTSGLTAEAPDGEKLQGHAAAAPEHKPTAAGPETQPSRARELGIWD